MPSDVQGEVELNQRLREPSKLFSEKKRVGAVFFQLRSHKVKPCYSLNRHQGRAKEQRALESKHGNLALLEMFLCCRRSRQQTCSAMKGTLVALVIAAYNSKSQPLPSHDSMFPRFIFSHHPRHPNFLFPTMRIPGS